MYDIERNKTRRMNFFKNNISRTHYTPDFEKWRLTSSLSLYMMEDSFGIQASSALLGTPVWNN